MNEAAEAMGRRMQIEIGNNVRSEVLEKHLTEIEFAQTTRQGMCDELPVHMSRSAASQPVARRISVQNRKALRALCNESGSNRSSSRTAFRYHHAGIRRVHEGPGWPTHTVGQEATWVL